MSPYPKYCLSTLLVVSSLTLLLAPSLHSQNNLSDTVTVPVTMVFYHMDRNILGSVAQNYGMNYLVAGLGTYGLVKSGVDWKWYRNAQEHPWTQHAGFVAVGVGPLASVAVPLGVYLYGRSENDRNLQLTGLAMGQAAIVGGVVTTVIKAFTGRVAPDEHSKPTDYSGDFRFGFLRGGVYEGWPSGHTTTAFAMATTLMELYPDNATIRYGGLAYASLIGLGVSTTIHWFSDAVAGALIGYAIGTTVGASYRSLMQGTGQASGLSLVLTPTHIGLQYAF